MKNKTIILFGVFSFVLLAMILLSFDWCFDSNDVCLQRKINSLRDVKAQLQLNIDKLNNQINDLKVQFSSGYVIEEAKQGRSQNVPKDLLQSAFHLIPTTYAATRPETNIRKYDQVWDSQISLSETHSNELDQKLANYLKKHQSPITLPVFTIAKSQGLTVDQTILLVAIMGHESKFGTIYAQSVRGKGVRIASPDLGKSYFNYSGIKWLPGCANQKLPDDNGFYLTRCPDQITFLRSYFSQIKKAYFDKKCDTAMCMRNWYVGGSAPKKIAWARAVNSFVKEISRELL